LELLLLPVADTNLRDFLLEVSGPENPDQRTKDILYRCFGCLLLKVRHNDIKPRNILIHQGEVLFTDFGLAFDFSKSSSSTSMGEPRAGRLVMPHQNSRGGIYEVADLTFTLLAVTFLKFVLL
jgi:serine/threonine protein kinase